MTLDTPPPRLSGPGRGFRLQATGFLGKLVALVAGAAGLVVALAFSVVLFAVLLVAGAAFGGWLWWKTRELRRALRSAPVTSAATLEREVAGEAVILRDDAGERPAR